MGNRIIAVDPLIGEFIRPSINAYVTGNYRGACTLLDSLNAFLLSFGAGISDMPTPIPNIQSLTDELKLETHYKNYFERYQHPVMKSLGWAIRQELLRVIEEKETI